jgi:hypothetical protein
LELVGDELLGVNRMSTHPPILCFNPIVWYLWHHLSHCFVLIPSQNMLTTRPMRANGTGSALPSTLDIGTSGALSIFAPPSSSEVPEALQGVISPSRVQSVDMNGNGNDHSSIENGNGIADGIVSAGPSSSSRELRVRLTIPNSAEEPQPTSAGSTRLRPTRGRESTQRVGVSASGKGVKLGGSTSTRAAGPSTANSVTRKKGVQTPEIVCPRQLHLMTTGQETDGKHNQDFCSVCRGIGSFLCCDGCPRSFHFMCLEPPLRVDELPEEDQWFCRKCKVERVSLLSDV